MPCQKHLRSNWQLPSQAICLKAGPGDEYLSPASQPRLLHLSNADSVSPMNSVTPHDHFAFRRSLSSLQERLLQRARSTAWPVSVTAYLTDVKIHGHILLGVIWYHRKASAGLEQFADGHLIRTSDVCGWDRVGRNWIVETRNSHYVIVNFTRANGRAEFAQLRHLWLGRNTKASSAP